MAGTTKGCIAFTASWNCTCVSNLKRLVREKPELLAEHDSINQMWSMDFMHNYLSDGGGFRTFNVIGDFNREGLMSSGWFFSGVKACNTFLRSSCRVARQA